MTKLTAADGHAFDLYEVRPDDAAAAIVVIQEIFGVNDHIRSVVDRYASFGYHAVAPALFDRVKPGVEFDYDAMGIGDKVAEVVLIVLLVMEGRRDRTGPATANTDRYGR